MKTLRPIAAFAGMTVFAVTAAGLFAWREDLATSWRAQVSAYSAGPNSTPAPQSSEDAASAQTADDSGKPIALQSLSPAAPSGLFALRKGAEGFTSADRTSTDNDRPAPQDVVSPSLESNPTEGANAPASETPATSGAFAIMESFASAHPAPPHRPKDLVDASNQTAPLPPIRPLGQSAALSPSSDATTQPNAHAPALPESALPDPALPASPLLSGEKKIKSGDPVYVRIFKKEGELELWYKQNGKYALAKTYPICKWSGLLGPKTREADYQSPEGFYSVSAKQLRPNSNYYRAFNVGYPNAFDRQNGRTGGLIMVHGDCKSVGCFAMTNKGIEQIYAYVAAAIGAGQSEVPVHIFPFRMTEKALNAEISGGGFLSFMQTSPTSKWGSFWKNLKEGYDLFEKTGEPPVAYACGDHYAFDAPGASCKRIAGW